MASIVLKEKTVGEIHRNYNYALLKSTIDPNIEKINYYDQDLDNIFKIDRAIRNRNVDYILETLKCKDLFYCSRVIKESTWMITDPQYSEIINPSYLYSQLFPEMLTKAQNKLLLQIRVNIKDKERAKDFFMCLKKININKALKWLPYCSEELITENLKIYINNIPLSVLMRLTEISLNFLYIFCTTESESYNRVSIHSAVKCGMKYGYRDVKKYLDILDSIEEQHLPILNTKITKLIMKTCPERILNNFERYIKIVDTKTFAKSIKQSEIKAFLIERFIGGKHKLNTKIKHFIMRLPGHERFEFVREYIIDKEHKIHSDFQLVTTTLDNIYRWYIYASFDKAFNDLKQLIRLESNANERNAMLSVILECAGTNPQNIYDLLEYYKTSHINEAFKFKNSFINTLLDKTCPCDFDERTWTILQDIFMSMEVFSESDNNVQTCIRWIMLYKIIRNQAIPEIVVSKLNFTTFKKERSKIKDCDKEKVFSYLLALTREGLNKSKTEDYQNLQLTVIWTNNMLNLLRDWHQDLKNYPDLIKTIQDISGMPKEKRATAVFNHIYNKNKSWRRYLINESILLNPSEETFINALKHNPKLLCPRREEIKTLCCNDKISLKYFLRKLRIYNTHLAHDFEETYSNNLDRNIGVKASIIGLCAILQPQKLSAFIMKYIPEENKINWNKIDERKLNVQKHIAGNMHLARPQPSMDLILSFAQGDYLQFALAPLSSALCNMSRSQLLKKLYDIMNTPVSLQKHIIRGAFMKCQIDDLVVILTNIWEKTKNSSIRATVFKLTFNLLCQQTESEKIESIWSLIINLIDTLTPDENKIIFLTFTHLNQVPVQVRPAFCIKSYAFIKMLPERSNCKHILNQIITCTKDIMELMDTDFMIEILMESYIENLFQNVCQCIDVYSAFLLSTKDEKSQIYRYNKVLSPLLQDIESIWKLEKDNLRKLNIGNLLNTLLGDIDNIVIKKNMLMPITLFKLILIKLNDLPFEENYTLITSRRLALEFIVILETCLADSHGESYSEGVHSEHINLTKAKESSRNNYIVSIRKFSKICLNHLVEDIQKYGTSIVVAYGAALNVLFDNFRFCDANMKLELCEAILNETETKDGVLLVLQIIPYHRYDLDEKKQMQLLKKISSHPDNEVKILCSVFKNDLNFLI